MRTPLNLTDRAYRSIVAKQLSALAAKEATARDLDYEVARLTK